MLFGYSQLRAVEEGGFPLEEVGFETTTSGFAMVTLATGVVMRGMSSETKAAISQADPRVPVDEM